MKFICVLAMPRTGSSHVNKLLKSIPQVNAKSELFHRAAQARFTRREADALERRGAPVDDNEAMIAWRRANPAATIEGIQEGSREPVLAFKVFPNHLPRPVMRDAFFTRDDMAFLLLRRRPIECYISGLKARSAGSFTLIDTTAMKPALDIDDFLEWSERVRRWYGWFQHTLEEEGKPFGTISFERHLDGKTGRQSLELILPMLKDAGFDMLTMPNEVIEGERQDQEARYQDRVANWDAFVEAMGAAGRDGLLDWAMREG
ncbi:MAG TPA: sulfotransferase [Rhizomicrobium sp.]|nr:sulfotransferase [Rhizomicrobium sp.]